MTDFPLVLLMMSGAVTLLGAFAVTGGGSLDMVFREIDRQ